MAHKYKLFAELHVSISEAQKHNDPLQEAHMTFSDNHETKKDIFSEDGTG